MDRLNFDFIQRDMGLPFSVLDLVGMRTDELAGKAIARSVDLAQNSGVAIPAILTCWASFARGPRLFGDAGALYFYAAGLVGSGMDSTRA